MGTSQRTATEYAVFNGTTTGIANWNSSPVFCDDFRNAILEFTAIAGSTLTIKIKWSNFSRVDTQTTAENIPNFASADSVTNPWSYMQGINLADGSLIAGTTGFTYTASAGTNKIEVNANQVRWLGVEIAGLSAGGIKAKWTLSDNR